MVIDVLHQNDQRRLVHVLVCFKPAVRNFQFTVGHECLLRTGQF